MAAYATSAELGRFSAIPATVLAGADVTTVSETLEAASRTADSYLAARYALPLVTWDDDLRQVVCDVAAYRLMGRLGYAPEGSDNDFRLRYEDALAWLQRVADGRIHPTVDVMSPAADLPATVTSNTARGW